MSAVVIGNPKAGRGGTDRYAEVIRELAAHEIAADLWATEGPGHAIELAARARREGIGLVVAAGGDGTVHEVVNGLLADDAHEMPLLGLVPFGSGCDYVKTFDIPNDLGSAVTRIVSTTSPRSVDAGTIEYESSEGRKRRFFANIAEVGIGPEVVDRASRLPRALGPAMYFAGFCATLPRYRARAARIDIDGTESEVRLTNLVVAIGQVFGGGMRVAPNADPSDGMFDVQVQTGSKLDYVRGIPKVYKGTHVPHPRIQEARGRTITVTCDPPALIEADGEVLGSTPATFRVLPAALRLKA